METGHREEADAALAELVETRRHDMAFQIAEVYAYRTIYRTQLSSNRVPAFRSSTQTW